MIAIDILYLVDRLEALLSKGWRVPMTSKTMINEDEFLDIVDQMRIAIPEEIKAAKKLQQERERMLAQAQEEAARLLAMAKEDASHLVDDHAIAKAAQERAIQIETKARSEAQTSQEEADAYAAQVLAQLEARLSQVDQQVQSLQAQVTNGLELLTQRHAEPEEEPAPLQEDLS